MNPEEIAIDILAAVSRYLGPEWIVQQIAKMFSREQLDAILEAEYKAAEIAAELAEKEAFK